MTDKTLAVKIYELLDSPRRGAEWQADARELLELAALKLVQIEAKQPAAWLGTAKVGKANLHLRFPVTDDRPLSDDCDWVPLYDHR